MKTKKEAVTMDGNHEKIAADYTPILDIFRAAGINSDVVVSSLSLNRSERKGKIILSVRLTGRAYG